VELYNDTQPYTSFNTSFHGLDEYVEYSVRILGTTIKGEGPKSDPVTCRTDEDGTCGNDGSQPVHVFHSSEVTPPRKFDRLFSSSETAQKKRDDKQDITFTGFLERRV
jgi:hypothetical protein